MIAPSVPGDTYAPVVEPAPTTAVPKLSASEAYRMMQQNSELVVLDVRTDQEYARGHLPKAVLLPYDLVDERTTESVIPSTATPVLVYCRSGRRAELAAQALTELGYTNVYNIGGIESWPYATTTSTEGLPVVSWNTTLEAVHPPSYQHMAHLAHR